jgi:hypothetical protein
MRVLAVVAALALAASAAQARSNPDCPRGLKPMISAELFFGADQVGGGQVDETAWTHFLDTEVTPRFPEGLTTWVADGRWRAPSGAPTHERSRVLLLLISPDAATRARLEAVRTAFRTQFHQLSVGLVEHRECAGF